MSTDVSYVDNKEILSEATLPCGRKIQNRLVKAALYEHLAFLLGGPPNDMHFALYSRWAAGGWGMIITGNVQVASDHLGLGRDVVIPQVINEETLQPFKKLASVIHGQDTIAASSQTLAIMQVVHTGRQSPNFLGGRPLFVPPKAPSAVPLEMRTTRGTSVISHVQRSLLFQTPREMSKRDVEDAVGAFVKAAQVAAKAGFDGVEIHAAHGYLVCQFMSQKTNIRTDEYSSKANPLLFLHRIVSAIRSSDVIPEDFVLGVKLNAADYVDTAAGVVSSEDRPLQHLQAIASWGLVDFIEISGGDYDSPDFLESRNTSRRQAVFEGFSKRAMQALTTTGSSDQAKRPLIMLTGGLHSPDLMQAALSHKHTDLLGIGRGAVLQPELPRHLTSNVPPLHPPSGEGDGVGIFPLFDANTRNPLPLQNTLERALVSTLTSMWGAIPDGVRPELPTFVGAGAETARYAVLMRALARKGEKTVYPGGDLAVLVRFWGYVAPGSGSGSWSWKSGGWVVLLVGFWAAALIRGV